MCENIVDIHLGRLRLGEERKKIEEERNHRAKI